MATTDAHLATTLLPDLILVEDLAIRLKGSSSAIRSMLRRGLLPGCKLGRRWVIERGELIQALRELRQRGCRRQCNAMW